MWASDLADGRGPASRPESPCSASDGGSFALIPLTKEDGYLTDIEWSPDGSRLAVSRWDDSNRSGIWVMNADGTDVRRMTPEDVNAQGPEWSPDGEWIAFSADLGATEEQRAESEENQGEGPWLGWGLYAMRPDGSDVRPSCPGGGWRPHDLCLARLGPDGEWRRVSGQDSRSERDPLSLSVSASTMSR